MKSEKEIQKELLCIEIRGLDLKPVQKHEREQEIMQKSNAILKELDSDYVIHQDASTVALYCLAKYNNIDIVCFSIISVILIGQIDDICDGDWTLISKWLKYLESKDCPGDNHLERVYKILLSYGGLVLEDHLDQILIAMQRSILSGAEMRIRVKRDGFIDQDYLKRLRVYDFGMETSFLLKKIDAGLVVDQELTQNYDWIQFNWNACIHCVLVNELFSLKKEVLTNQYKCNYVFVKMMANDLSAQMAADTVVEECHEHYRLALDHADNLKKMNNQQLNDYIGALFTFMNGSLYWSPICDRYNKLSTTSKQIPVPTKEAELSVNQFLYSSDSILNRVLNQISDKHLIELIEDIRQLYEYNVLNGKQIRGKLIVRTYDMVCEEPDQSVRDLAHVLGWGLEMFQAFALILDDIMDGSETRRKQLCWYKKVGLSAITDAILIQQQCFEIIRLYFSQTKYYTKILEMVNRTSLLTIYGQKLDMTSEAINKKINFNQFTKQRLKTLYQYKTSYYTFVYPVKMGLVLCDMDTVEEWPLIEAILLELGHLFQMQDDFIDCFGDPNITGKVGTDIEDGKCCWNAVTALQYCSEEQRNAFEECYGKSDKESVNTVKHIYSELNLQKLFEDEFSEIESDIRQRIKSLNQSKNDKFTKILDYVLNKLLIQQTYIVVNNHKQKYLVEVTGHLYEW